MCVSSCESACVYIRSIFGNGGGIVYFLGIDGGGTKTDFLLLDENGKTIAQRKIGTISYKHVGIGLCDRITERKYKSNIRRE